MAFVMVLSWSRQVFLQFFLDARMESFLRGHIAAFHVWNGLPRILLYDFMWSTPLCGVARLPSRAGRARVLE
jgi:transposase